jgi:hypothetical protein
MGFDRRHHGGPGHSEADDTYPNCGIRLFGHYLLLLLAMTVLKGTDQAERILWSGFSLG